jgi:OmpA-OmpF porin, OOP family
MADSIFASLLNMLDSRTVGEVAHTLGQPKQSVLRGVESSIASLIGGLASKSNDPVALRNTLDIVPSDAGTVSWSQVAAGVTAPNPSLIAAGRRLPRAIFGDGEDAVMSGIRRASGLSREAIGTMLTMAGLVVVSSIGKQVRDTGITMRGLGSLLQKESETLRIFMPAGLSELFLLDTKAVGTASPVVAQARQREGSAEWLLPAVGAAALALGLTWLLARARRPNRAYRLQSRIPTPKQRASGTSPRQRGVGGLGSESTYRNARSRIATI